MNYTFLKSCNLQLKNVYTYVMVAYDDDDITQFTAIYKRCYS